MPRVAVRRAFESIFAGVLVALVSCGFTGDSSRFGKDVLVMNNMAEPGSLDPALQTSAEEQRITLALFEGLTSHHPETLEPVAGVAESWEVSADGLTYRFRLRECLWSNGDPVRAGDFAWAWRRVLTPRGEDAPPGAVSSRYADLLFCIDGARAWHAGAREDFARVGVTVLGDRDLEVRLERPTPWFLELLCFPTFMPVHRATVERHGERWTRPDVFVGNGPFVLAERRLGDHIRVTRNPRYWDRGAVALDGLVYYATDQIDTALDQYLAGETDWVRSFNPKKVRAWRADAELSAALRAPEFLATYFYRFNVTRPPLDDARVRRALACAVDRAAVTRHVTGLGEEPAEGLVPPCVGMEWRDLAGRGLGFDPQRAREWLAEAGYPGGRGFPTIALAFNTDTKNRAVAEVVQAMWREHLGIEIELENREKRVHYAAERSGDYDISRGNWIGDFDDPMTFLEFMTSESPSNRTGWRNDEYDRLVAAARGERDDDARRRLMERAEEILVIEDAVLLTVFYYRNAFVLRPDRVTGFWPNARDLHPPKSLALTGS